MERPRRTCSLFPIPAVVGGVLVAAVLIILVVVIIVVVIVKIEGIERGDAQVTAAGLTIPRVADLHFLEVVVIDFQFGVTFRTRRHAVSFVASRPSSSATRGHTRERPIISSGSKLSSRGSAPSVADHRPRFQRLPPRVARTRPRGPSTPSPDASAPSGRNNSPRRRAPVICKQAAAPPRGMDART